MSKYIPDRYKVKELLKTINAIAESCDRNCFGLPLDYDWMQSLIKAVESFADDVAKQAVQKYHNELASMSVHEREKLFMRNLR